MRSKKKRGLRLLLLLGHLLHYIIIITTTRTTILFCQQSCTTFMYSCTSRSPAYTPQSHVHHQTSNTPSSIPYMPMMPLSKKTSEDALDQGFDHSTGSLYGLPDMSPDCKSHSKYPLSVSTYLFSRNHFEPIIEVKKEIDCI